MILHAKDIRATNVWDIQIIYISCKEQKSSAGKSVNGNDTKS